MFGTKDRTEEIINLIWNRDEYYLVAAGKDAPSEDQVKQVAAKYGVRLPADYIAHTTGQWGSPYLEVREEFWPRHKAGAVGPFWTFLYGVFVFAYSENAPDWMRIDFAADEFERMGHKVLPILKVIGDADVYCINPEGKIIRWQHEGDSFEPFNGTFFDLLEYEFRELDSRRIQKKAKLSDAPES